MSFAMREMKARLSKPSRWYIWAGVSIVCGISGPFYTHDMFTLAGSILFWGFVAAVALVLANAIDLTLSEATSQRRLIPRAVKFGLIFGAIFCLFLKGLIWLLLPEHEAAATPLWYLFFQSSIIASVVILLRDGLTWKRPAAAPPPGKPRFLQRLAPALGQSVLRVSSQDHYVEVRTEKGRDMILMRFADALNELQGVDGAQVHRFHWVSRAAVQSVERASGKIKLRLNDGSVIPVSRSFRAAAERAGLI